MHARSKSDKTLIRLLALILKYFLVYYAKEHELSAKFLNLSTHVLSRLAQRTARLYKTYGEHSNVGILSTTITIRKRSEYQDLSGLGFLIPQQEIFALFCRRFLGIAISEASRKSFFGRLILRLR